MDLAVACMCAKHASARIRFTCMQGNRRRATHREAKAGLQAPRNHDKIGVDWPSCICMLDLIARPVSKASLQKLCDQVECELYVEEWDILRSESQDLSNPQVVQTLISRIQAQEFDAIFMSPPCNKWSRAPHSKTSKFWGPCPVRNRQWPRGFPWADGKFKEQALLGNLLVDVCFTICSLVCNDPRCAHVKIIWEHPEDLGAAWDATGRKVFPASIWQLPEMENLLKQASWITVAFFQCRFQVNRLKPTRLLSNIPALHCLGLVGPPEFDSAGWYIGPLPPTCSHGGHPSLIKKRQTDDFQTTGTGVYPPLMDDALAAAIFSAWYLPHSDEGERVGSPGGSSRSPCRGCLAPQMVHPFYSPP